MNGYETIPCTECGEQTIAARPVCSLCEADKGLFAPKQTAEKRNFTRMNRAQALPYVSYYLDDALSVKKDTRTVGVSKPDCMPDNARLIGWQCGNEPMFVAVWSYLGVELDAEEAEEIAVDYLSEIGWFSNRVTKPDYVI